MLLRSVRIVLLLNTLLLTFTADALTSDLDQHLKNQYQHKIFLLRGFYSGGWLHYDASGAPLGAPSPGSWTIDGFILVTGAKAHGQTLKFTGRRMPVISVGQGFLFRADSPEKRNEMPGIEIEAKLGSGNPIEEVDAVAAKIFLTDQDSLAASVPWYWQSCVAGGLKDVNDPKYVGCHFSAELLTVPGVNPHADPQAIPEKGEPNLSEHQIASVFRVGNDISPPRATFTPEPQFSGLARETGLRGVVTLGVIVDDQGIPRNVHILSPLGAGLDEEAVAAIRTWKFKPAEQKGHGPVAVEIAVQVDFHTP
jgi:TonB family protein